MRRTTRSELQMDIHYVQSIRDKYERAYDRINTLTLENSQLRARVKLLDDGFESLNEKYIAVCTELKGTDMENKTAIDIALAKLQEAQDEILKLFPPPYAFPSADGRTAQLIADSINTAKLIKNREN
jgi:hypothetical protein